MKNKETLHTDFYPAINLRNYTKDPTGNEILRHCGAQIALYFTIDANTNFWELATECHTKLRNETKCFHYPDSVNINEDILPTIDTFKSETRDRYLFELGVSNLGRIEIFENIPGYNVHECFFTFLNKAALYGMYALITSLNNKIFINFCYTQPLFSEEFANAYANHYMTLLNDICEEN